MMRQSETISLFRGLFRQLPPSKRTRFWILLFGSVVIAVGEACTAGAIALFASAVASPQTVVSSSLFDKASALYPSLQNLTPEELLMWLSIIVVGLVVSKHLLSMSIQFAHAAYMAYISGLLGEKMLEGLMRMPYQWLVTKNSADLITTVNWARGSGNFLNGIFKIVSDILIIAFLLSALLMVNPQIVVGCLVVLGAFGAVIFSKLKRYVDDAAKRLNAHTRSANRHLTKGLQGIKDIKVFGKEAMFIDDFLLDVYAVPRITAQQKVFAQIPGGILESMGFAALCASTYIMYFGSGYTTAKVTGIIALIAVAAWRGLPAVIRILTSITSVRNHIPLVTNTLNHFDQIAEKQDPLPSQEADMAIMQKSFALSGISYKYDKAEDLALDSIDLYVAKGESIGIIGHSGAGKSTLTDIMIGLLHPLHGTCMVDGKPLDSQALKNWTSRVGYVPQAPYIYDGTLAENVAFGFKHEEIDNATLSEAIQMAAVHEFSEQFPEGVHTPIGERGARLSGGQQQRVCIARALYTKPDILIFDEATSSLDPRSERLIQDTIQQLKGNVTMIIVAHRLTTVVDCDKILWLDKGRVKMFDNTNTVLELYNAEMASTNAPIREKTI